MFPPLTGSDTQGGFVYRKLLPAPDGVRSNDSVRVLGNKQLSGSGSRNGHKPPAEQTGEANPEHKPQVFGTGRVKTPKAHIALDKPPLTPLAALSYTLVISCVSSSDADKRKIADKAMRKIESLERKYADEKGRSYLQTVFPLVVSSAIKIGNFNKAVNRRLERAADCRDSKIDNAKDLLDMRMAYLEKSKLVVNVPSIPKWFASIGVSVAAIYMIEKEVVNYIAQFPPLADLKNLAYGVAVSAVVGIVMGTRKLINWMLSKKQEKVTNEFYERKGKAESKFNSIEEDLLGKYINKAVEKAANVFAETTKLCEASYQAFISTDAVLGPVYTRYVEIRASTGEEAAYRYLMDVGKLEAQRQFSDSSFFQEAKYEQAGSFEKKQ